MAAHSGGGGVTVIDLCVGLDCSSSIGWRVYNCGDIIVTLWRHGTRVFLSIANRDHSNRSQGEGRKRKDSVATTTTTDRLSGRRARATDFRDRCRYVYSTSLFVTVMEDGPWMESKEKEKETVRAFFNCRDSCFLFSFLFISGGRSRVL